MKEENNEESKEEKNEENKDEIKEEIDNLNAEEEAYEKLKNSKFKQQNLPGWKPEISNNVLILIFICFGIAFIIIGTFLLIASNNLVEIKKNYGNNENCKIKDMCDIEIKITKTMKKPIMIYYQIDGIYQNHRRYLNSKSDEQLHGKKFTLEGMKNSQDCEPVVTNKEMDKKKSITGKDLKDTSLAIPCGLIARSYFNDIYTNFKIDGKQFYPNENNISWETDRKLKYRNVDINRQWINMTDEHFMVWMRPAALPNFKKLWARIDDIDLEEGQTLTLTVGNNYDVSKFKGEKYLVLRTVNIFGGKNNKMGISYIFIGVICIILGIVFFVGDNIYKNKHK